MARKATKKASKPKANEAEVDEVEADEAEAGKPKVDKGEAELFAVLMQLEMEGNRSFNFDAVAGKLGCHPRNNAKRAIWKSFQDQGFVEPSALGKGFQVSQKGIEHGATDEYKEFVKDMNFVPQTNEEHQERIKKRFKVTKSAELFDLFLKHGSLSRLEVAALIGQKDRSHAVSYALQELKKKKELLEVDPEATTVGQNKKFCLSDKAFLKAENRPEPEVIDPDVLAEKVAKNAKPRSSKKKEPKVNKSKSKKRKASEQEDEGPTEVEDKALEDAEKPNLVESEA